MSYNNVYPIEKPKLLSRKKFLEQNAKLIASDWKAVGNDLRKVMNDFDSKL